MGLRINYLEAERRPISAHARSLFHTWHYGKIEVRESRPLVGCSTRSPMFVGYVVRVLLRSSAEMRGDRVRRIISGRTLCAALLTIATCHVSSVAS